MTDRPATSAQVSALRDGVQRAHERLQKLRKEVPDAVLWTPLMRSRTWLEEVHVSSGVNVPEATKGVDRPPVFIKLESEQVTGSFKVRGAINAVQAAHESARARRDDPPRIVTASTGNHAMAIAHSLEVVGAEEKGLIYLPHSAKPAKINALRAYSKAVTLELTEGDDCVFAERAAAEFAERSPTSLYLSPCDNMDVISGNGTIAAEVLDSWNALRLPPGLGAPTVYCCVGGGGMISGIGAYLKANAPTWRLVGAQPDASAVMKSSVEAGQVVHTESLPTYSDGSAGGLDDDCVTLGYCMSVVDEWITVSEQEIADAVKGFCDHHHKVIEGAGGVAIAAFLKDSGRTQNSPAIIVACGANIGAELLLQILQQ